MGVGGLGMRSGLAGGEGGIRTLDELLTHTPLAGERLQPLGHLSALFTLCFLLLTLALLFTRLPSTLLTRLPHSIALNTLATPFALLFKRSLVKTNLVTNNLVGKSLARWEGVEPPTFWFVARCSIQLSYQRVQESGIIVPQQK